LEQRLETALARNSDNKGATPSAAEVSRPVAVANFSEAVNAPSVTRASAPALAAGAVAPPVGGDDEAPWPTEEFSAAVWPILAVEPSGPATPVVSGSAAPPEETDAAKVPLPSLDSLVSRIPAEVRETLEDLFRAKFTVVRRVAARDLEKT
jgi:hypothetical protein